MDGKDHKTDRLRIAIAVERTALYGRNVLRGISEVAGRHPEWDLSLVDPRHVAALAKRNRFDGWICRIPDARAAVALARTRRPVVNLTQPRDASPFAFVRTDAAAICDLAAEHLLTRRYPAYAFCGYRGIYFSDVRRDAFIASVAKAGFAVAVYEAQARRGARFDSGILLGDSLDEAPDAAALRAWAQRLPKPTAVFCCNDLRAAQLLRVCSSLGIAVPGQIAILGVDDDPMLCLFSSPRLSSIDSDSMAVGRAAVEALAEMLAAPDEPPPRKTISPRGLVARASTDAYPGAPAWLPDVLAWISANVGHNLSACDVFRHAGRSRTLVERVFRKQLGTTVQRQIAAARVAKAKLLLTKTKRPAAEIALEAGFSSAEYFSRVFATATGLAPAAWRERERE